MPNADLHQVAHLVGLTLEDLPHCQEVRGVRAVLGSVVPYGAVLLMHSLGRFRAFTSLPRSPYRVRGDVKELVLGRGIKPFGMSADCHTKMGRVFRITNKLSKINFCNNVAKSWKP